MNNNNNPDGIVATASVSLATLPPSLEVRSGGTSPMMGEVEQRREQLPRTPKVGDSGAVAGSIAAKQEAAQPGIRMVRYRLDVGRKHQLTAEELKKILVEESGVDKKNINIIHIQGDYTLVELPDEMPQDIFLHLKSVEIKQHKLDIKRVKVRNKKRGNTRRRGRLRTPQPDKEGFDQTV